MVAGTPGTRPRVRAAGPLPEQQTQPTAQRDLDLASASLTLEATNRGIHVHQMAGLMPDKARESLAIPEGSEAVKALALGYRRELGTADPNLLVRDDRPRTRGPLDEFVFREERSRSGHPSSQ